MSVQKRKQALRAEMKQRLGEHSSRAARTAAARIADRVLAIPEVAEAKGILLCLSFGDEVDTWVLVDRLIEMERAVYIPRSATKPRQLHVHRYPCALETLSFGLQQPPRGTPEVPESDLAELIDVALILGLGFDQQGYRLGHGAGYFDRFLANRPFPAIGLAFEFQLLAAVPNEPHDIPMAAIVTESRVWRPRAAASQEA